MRTMRSSGAGQLSVSLRNRCSKTLSPQSTMLSAASSPSIPERRSRLPHNRASIVRTARAIALGSTLLALAACASTGNYGETAPAGASIFGTWKLNPGRSSDEHQALQQLRKRGEQRTPRNDSVPYSADRDVVPPLPQYRAPIDPSLQAATRMRLPPRLQARTCRTVAGRNGLSARHS